MKECRRQGSRCVGLQRGEIQVAAQHIDLHTQEQIQQRQRPGRRCRQCECGLHPAHRNQILHPRNKKPMRCCPAAFAPLTTCCKSRCLLQVRSSSSEGQHSTMTPVKKLSVGSPFACLCQTRRRVNTRAKYVTQARSLNAARSRCTPLPALSTSRPAPHCCQGCAPPSSSCGSIGEVL
jgi:hypothetical protein